MRRAAAFWAQLRLGLIVPVFFIGQRDLIVHVVWVIVWAVDAVDGHAILFDNLEGVSVADPVAA